MAKKKDEAKIKFTAETGEFNEQIKSSESSLKEFRSELKLNSAEMNVAGESCKLLEKRQEILAKELEAARSKTEALNAKLQKAKEIFGDNSEEARKLQTQVNNASSAEKTLEKEIADCNARIEKQISAEKEAKTATSKLTDEIEEQQSELSKLKKDYSDAVLQYGKNSDEAKKLSKEIKKLSSEVSDNKKKLDDATDAANKLDKSFDGLGDSVKDAGDGFTVAKGIISDLASSAIQGAINKVSEFKDYLMDLPEATREIRQDMATLETSFQRQGFTMEAAESTWKDLYAIFGEDDRAVEASNLIAKMSKDQEDLNTWVTITKGIWGSYQDSLPVEGLAEASMETAKTGQVTGVLADALNWNSDAAKMFSKYMSEDVTTAEDAFNEALKKCTTEQERQALINETLTKLYSGAATEYDKASGAQTKAKEATADNILIQNQLADTMEPLTTELQNTKNELLQGLMPAVEGFSTWGVNALNWLKEHPGAMQAVVVVVSALAGALTALATITAIMTIKQWLMNAAWLASPITWIVVGIVAAVAALVAIGVTLYQNWDKVKAAGEKCFNGIKDGCSKAWQGVKNAWGNTKQWFADKWNGIKNVFSNVGSWFREKFNSAKQGVQNAWSNVTGFFSNIYSKIKNKFAQVKNAITQPFKTAIDKVKGFFNNLKLKFPKIKMPHFKITGKFSLSPPSVPKLGIEWYDKGAILTKPTVFGMNGFNAMVGGETKPEAIVRIDKLQGYIGEEIEKHNQNVGLIALAESIARLAERPIGLNVNGRRFAEVTAGDSDNVNGLRTQLLDRGLILT